MTLLSAGARTYTYMSTNNVHVLSLFYTFVDCIHIHHTMADFHMLHWPCTTTTTAEMPQFILVFITDNLAVESIVHALTHLDVYILNVYV